MTDLTAQAVLRGFMLLTALRWLPVGLLIPVMVLLPLDRGLSLTQLGVAAATQGFVVFALELPAGGLADAIGRRRVLLVAMVVAIASTAVFLAASTFVAFVVVFALQGIYRALDSGPLEAWYVDTAQAADAEARIDRGMSAHGTVLGLSIAVGALTSGGLIALDPIPAVNALVVPVLLALVPQVVGMVAVIALMVEAPPNGSSGLGQSIRATPRTIRAGIGLLRSSPVLLALVAVEVFWGFGLVCFEKLLPVRLTEVVGGTDAAAALTGPATSAAWLASAVGSAALAATSRWLPIPVTAGLMRVVQGLTVAAMGLFSGVVGILVAFLACHAAHGTSNAAHMTLLHRQATGSVRATVVSLNSMVSQPAAGLGMIALTALAQATSVSTAMYVGGTILAIAAPLYLPAWRQARREPAPDPGEPSAAASLSAA